MAQKRWWLIFLLFLPLAAASLTINEVMYAPTEEYGGRFNEWIELYNGEVAPYDASSCSVDGTVVGNYTIEPYGYLVIAKVLTTFAEFYPNVTAIDGNFNLNNGGDTINLNCSDANISFSYTFDMGGSTKNKTLERNFEQEWGDSKVEGGTPGQENSIANVSFHELTLVISEVMANPWENDDWPAPDGEWIELYNYGEREIYAGGLKITDINGENELFIAETSTSGESLFIPPQGYLVVYRDGDYDFSLNNNGYEEVRLVPEEDTGIVIDFMSYDDANTEGMSWSNVEGEWYLTSPTPLGDNEYTGECIWGLFIDTNNSIYRQEDFSFGISVDRFAGLADEITVRGQIEDEHGEVIRTYAPWSNVTVTSDRRERYSPNLPAGVYQVSFWFENPPCLDIDPVAYRVTKLIAISPSYQRFSPAITINELNVGSDNSVKWGQQFTAKVTLYTGNTTRSTVEFWADKNGKVISPKTKVNTAQQFKEYSVTIPLQLIPNCDNDISDGTAGLKAQGLGISAQQEFQIKGVDKNVCTDYLDYIEEQEEQNSKSKLSYALTNIPASVAPQSAFKITAKIENENKKHTFKTWAYVYRGSKCYSCREGKKERDVDAEEFTLDGKEDKEVDLLLKLDEEMEEGEYKVKVLFNKDNQKTNKDVVESLYVQVPEEKKEANGSLETLSAGSNEKFSSLSSFRSRATGATSGIVVYESNAEKSKKLIPYLLLVAGVLMVVVLWKKK